MRAFRDSESANPRTWPHWLPSKLWIWVGTAATPFVPSASGCVLMDLGRMNRILDFSEDLAYITVEPGVTQQQVYAFLQER